MGARRTNKNSHKESSYRRSYVLYQSHHSRPPRERDFHHESFSISEIILEICKSDQKSEYSDDEFEIERIGSVSESMKESDAHPT